MKIQKLNSTSKPSLLELQSFTGQLDHSGNAAINFPFMFAALGSWMTEVGTDFSKIVSDIKLGSLLGDGFIEWGPVEETSYPKDLTGKAWQTMLVDVNNLSKRQFAESGTGVLLGILMIFIIKTVGIRALVAPVGSVYASSKAAMHRRELYAKIDAIDDLPEPPIIGDAANIQMGLADLILGMSKDSRKLLLRGHKRLVP